MNFSILQSRSFTCGFPSMLTAFRKATLIQVPTRCHPGFGLQITPGTTSRKFDPAVRAITEQGFAHVQALECYIFQVFQFQFFQIWPLRLLASGLYHNRSGGCTARDRLEQGGILSTFSQPKMYWPANTHRSQHSCRIGQAGQNQRRLRLPSSLHPSGC